MTSPQITEFKQPLAIHTVAETILNFHMNLRQFHHQTLHFQKYKLLQHYREAHPGAELNLCNMCGFRTPDAFMLQQHILKIHGGDEG